MAFGFLAVALLTPSLTACHRPYRVGEYVLVEWETGKTYPAYIIEIAGKSRYRVHFDGYDSRWDEDVSIDRIKGRVEGPVTAPPPPAKVSRAARSPSAAPSGSAGEAMVANPFQPGDKVRVTWRGSVYAAVVLEILAKDRVLVHYEGHESAWDEPIQTDRIIGKRP